MDITNQAVSVSIAFVNGSFLISHVNVYEIDAEKIGRGTSYKAPGFRPG